MNIQDSLVFTFNSFDGSKLISSKVVEPGKPAGGWTLATEQQALGDGSLAITARFQRTGGPVENINIQASLHLENWSEENFVLFPAAAYAGNRFATLAQSYPPSFPPEERKTVMEPIIRESLPRLKRGGSNSKLEFVAGDMATPAGGIFFPDTQTGLFVLTGQRESWGEYGLSLYESDCRQNARLCVTMPCVKLEKQYCFYVEPDGIDSEYRGVDIASGEEITLSFRLFTFECTSIQGLFDKFTKIRKCISGEGVLRNEIPFSAVWEIQEEELGRLQWNEEYGYYAVGLMNRENQDWQIGWVGGGMSSYAMLYSCNELAKNRGLRTLDYMFTRCQSPEGFFYGGFSRGSVYGDDMAIPSNTPFTMVRKNADALYFILKHFCYLGKENVKTFWIKGARACADAFVRMWNRYGQWGQFINNETGEILVGSSSSAAAAIAALTLCYEWFDDKVYLDTAREAAVWFYKNYVQKGYLNGGPGEILSAPDSESTYALLESYVVLYEVTSDPQHLQMAKDVANQYITWTMSYDFVFPANTEFARHDIKTLGSVFANVQNKHSAPGICTFSGDALLKLYRATGEEKYMRSVLETAHNIVQYLARDDKRFETWDYNGEYLQTGCMCERVNTSDWERKRHIGGVFGGQCWCSVSCLLTAAELPGVYVLPDKGLCYAFDHVEARLQGSKLHLHNPTGYDARVSVLCENAAMRTRPLGQCGQKKWAKILVSAHGDAVVELDL